MKKEAMIREMEVERLNKPEHPQDDQQKNKAHKAAPTPVRWTYSCAMRIIPAAAEEQKNDKQND